LPGHLKIAENRKLGYKPVTSTGEAGAGEVTGI